MFPISSQGVMSAGMQPSKIGRALVVADFILVGNLGGWLPEISITPDIGPTQIIDQKEYHVGPSAISFRHGSLRAENLCYEQCDCCSPKDFFDRVSHFFGIKVGIIGFCGTGSGCLVLGISYSILFQLGIE